MRLFCASCGKSVSTELPDDTVVRAALVCPECIESEKVIFTTLSTKDMNVQNPSEDKQS
jgi:hypothetical protein